MIEVKFTQVSNGYVVDIVDGKSDNVKHYVYKSTEILHMLEVIGKLVFDRRVVVTER